MRCSDNPGMAKVTPRFKTKPRHFIREWRKFRHLTQAQLAERADLTHGAISQLENAEVNYTQPTLEALADALQCSPGDLIMRRPDDPDAPWSIWDNLKPEQRKQAVRLLKALKDEAA